MSDALFCRAELNYVLGEDPAPTEMDVWDGRACNLPGWERCGFELMRQPSAVEDWGDDDEIVRVHYPEVIALAKRLTGCDHALVGGHIKRNPDQAALHEDLGPIAFVHSDFAESYGDRMREFYASGSEASDASLARAGITGADVAAARRMLIIQFWRNLGPARMDLPIAFCDAQSVAREELAVFPVSNYAGGGFDFETLGVTAPTDGHHRWYVFPELTPDEVVVFRTYDSLLVDQGKPFWTPHSAFRDPDVPLGAPSRSSIELRATCLYM